MVRLSPMTPRSVVPESARPGALVVCRGRSPPRAPHQGDQRARRGPLGSDRWPPGPIRLPGGRYARTGGPARSAGNREGGHAGTA